MTLLAVLTFVGIFYYCGLGPALLLFPARKTPWRLAIMPALGLCAHIVFSILLAQFSLTGQTISIITLPFFGLLAVLGWKRNRVSLEELRMASPVILLGLLSVAAFGWPLIQSGMQNYIGFANPDQPFLIPVLEWIRIHSFGVPPQYADQFRGLGGLNGIPQNTVLAVFYVTSTVSLITGAPIGLLFNVTALSLIYLVPGGVYALAEVLQLPRKVCLMAALLVACSSLVAYTLYLSSLGAISVIAIAPVACALTIEFASKPKLNTALSLGVVYTSMYYNYLGAIGLLSLLLGVGLTHGLLRRTLPLGKALLFVGATAAGIILLFAPLAATNFRYFLDETFGSRFQGDAEILMSFALAMTELGIAFFWGLRFPTAGPWPFAQQPQGELWAFIIGAAFSLMLVFACCYPRSNLPSVFRLMLAAILGVIVFYAQRRIGYGVFKLVAWVHPLMVVAFTASVFTLSDWLLSMRSRALGWLVLFALPLYAVPNLELALRLGFTAEFPKEGLMLHNAPNLSFRDVRELRWVGERWGPSGIVAALPDPVAAIWAQGYLLGANVDFFPPISLSVSDSSPRSATNLPPGRFLLHSNDPEFDVVPLPECPAIWSNPSFALSRLDQCGNVLVFGQGWYRSESSKTSGRLTRFRWLRKRGELLLLNPANRSQRLRITMIAGPGNRAPSRTVSVFLNGVLLQRFSMVGMTQFVTKPFVARGPVSQIEILVDEQANPLPRPWALWNRWVAHEARRLNVAIASVDLVDADLDTRNLFSFVDLASPNGNTALLNGIFMDRWMGTEASLTLASPDPAPRELRVSGMAPGGVGLRFPFRLTAKLNGILLPPCEIRQPGDFQTHCPVPDALARSVQPGQAVRIDIQAEKTFTGAADPRALSLRLSRVELVPKPPEQ
jgi:hypothetical protein